ncbi:MAG: hypothetical protein FD124_3711 [Alphaproteobacteria bacterium]|nr:MAG: hypothetical protein FD124_3711 [Alphaproteobacteria bacterium]
MRPWSSEDEAILERTPQVVSALLRDLPASLLHGREGPDTWSPFEVLGHLIHGERTDWIPRARILLEHGEARAFEPFDRFAHLKEFEGRRAAELLDLFARLRRESLVAQRGFGLQPADLQRRGRHPELGTVTLGQLLATWVVHDLGHVAQIARVQARQYGTDVGPWGAYLPVLRR